ncbi:hypothetical protein D3C77_758500 [compost metagenome]
MRQHEQVRLVDVGKIDEAAVELAVQARQVDVVADLLGGGLLQAATDLRFHAFPAPFARADCSLRLE